jgi:hypothetical protein
VQKNNKLLLSTGIDFLKRYAAEKIGAEAKAELLEQLVPEPARLRNIGLINK